MGLRRGTITCGYGCSTTRPGTAPVSVRDDVRIRRRHRRQHAGVPRLQPEHPHHRRHALRSWAIPPPTASSSRSSRWPSPASWARPAARGLPMRRRSRNFRQQGRAPHGGLHRPFQRQRRQHRRARGISATARPPPRPADARLFRARHLASPDRHRQRRRDREQDLASHISTRSDCAAITASMSLYAAGDSSITPASLRHSTWAVASRCWAR